MSADDRGIHNASWVCGL